MKAWFLSWWTKPIIQNKAEAWKYYAEQVVIRTRPSGAEKPKQEAARFASPR